MLMAKSLLKSPAMLAVVVGLALAGCEANKKLPDNSGSLGLNGATPGSTQDFTVNVGDRVFFETDSAALTVTARTTLDRQAQWLIRYPNHPVTIEGHADERGTREYNLALGERRANAVRAYLVAQGAARSQIEVISYGEEKPANSGHNETAWAQNRRVEIVYR